MTAGGGRIGHGFGPVFDAGSRVLILGSFPSVKSREVGFYYGHPQNRFWRVLGRILNDPAPDGIEERKAYLSRHGVALWDSVVSCEITGSADASIRDPEPADLSLILSVSPVRAVFCNGALSRSLLQKNQTLPDDLPVFRLPSTSPANAAWSLDRLAEEWKIVSSYLK